MKNLLKIAFAVCAMFILVAFTKYQKRVFATPVVSIEKLEVEPINIIPEIKTTILDTDTRLFLNEIGFKESGNRYDIVNRYGYMGKYQFGKKTLEGLGYKVTEEEFLNNPLLQEEAMIALLKHNKKNLKRYIEKYDGEVVNNIYITESGILAAAHLAGPGNVKKFFRKGRDFKDGLGTTMTSYMFLFAGYKLDI